MQQTQGSGVAPQSAEDTRKDWTVVQEDVGLSTTDKLRVKDGWLYRTRTTAGVAMVFVPGE